MAKSGSSSCGCLVAIAILVMYVWGIVIIANKEVECSAKIRSTQSEISGKLKIIDDGGYFLFDKPISATSPGQACVFYKNDQVLGGGWIT